MAAVGAPAGVSAGLKRFNPFRDLAGVTALLSTVFGPELALESRSSARMVRWMQRYPSIGWIWLGFDAWFDGTVGGFVWLDEGRVVGNANIAPIVGSGSWILSNVAVVESQRGRGIGRALIEACMTQAWQSGADRVLLQVWERNRAALHLYQTLGFEEVGRVFRMTAKPDWYQSLEGHNYPGELYWTDLQHGDIRALMDFGYVMLTPFARLVRPSPLIPFRGSMTDQLRKLLPGHDRRLAVRRRVLRHGRVPVAALAEVPVDDELVRVTVLAPPSPTAEVVAAILAELAQLSARHSVSLIADLPASLDRLKTEMLEQNWELKDSLLQMSRGHPDGSKWNWQS